MFQLSPETAKAFSEAQDVAFEVKMVAFLRGNFPDAAEVPDDEMRAGVHRVLQRAIFYRITSELGQARFVISAWLLGEDFDTEHPAVNDVLSSVEVSEEDKCEWLERYVTEVFQRLGEE